MEQKADYPRRDSPLGKWVRWEKAVVRAGGVMARERASGVGNWWEGSDGGPPERRETSSTLPQVFVHFLDELLVLFLTEGKVLLQSPYVFVDLRKVPSQLGYSAVLFPDLLVLC